MARVLVEYSQRLQQAVDAALGTPSLSVDSGRRARGRSALTDAEDAGYSGYFKVLNSSTKKENGEVEFKLKVVDGADHSSDNCGYALVNGSMFEVKSEEIDLKNAQGVQFLYLKSDLNTQASPPAPAQPVFEVLTEKMSGEENIGRTLLATVKISGNFIVVTQQSFGVPNVFIWGSCE